MIIISVITLKSFAICYEIWIDLNWNEKQFSSIH